MLCYPIRMTWVANVRKAGLSSSVFLQMPTSSNAAADTFPISRRIIIWRKRTYFRCSCASQGACGVRNECFIDGYLYWCKRLLPDRSLLQTVGDQGRECLKNRKSSISFDTELFFGSGRRIRTLTYGVRVRCATFTQSRYILQRKNLETLHDFEVSLFGSGRRIRTLTYGVRVRCATFTQSRYISCCCHHQPQRTDYIIYTFEKKSIPFLRFFEKFSDGFWAGKSEPFLSK